MIVAGLDLNGLVLVLAGAVAAGFISGLAGFGTGLVASGFWFHVLPPQYVPPLAALASVAAQLVAMATIPYSYDKARAPLYLVAGLIGVPFGVLALMSASPASIKAVVGAFLVIYAVTQLLGLNRTRIEAWGGRIADAAVGLISGFLGGFAGLSGALLIVWLQMRAGSGASPRAVYQPFNLVILAFAAFAMLVSGQAGWAVLQLALLCLPATLGGAWIGARTYSRVSDAAFKQIVLVLLLTSGTILVGRSLLA